uniref:Uncharacterized protein n=1 Tax=Oncorhynchus mykiss TaxID=8022 RepID=A0A8C7U3T8_ONCMY
MQRLHRIITSINLTTPLPLPYKVLYQFENMTERLQLAGSNLGSLVTTYWLNSPCTVTKVSADGEQTDDDAERIHKRAKDLELFIKNNLLAAEGTVHLRLHTLN